MITTTPLYVEKDSPIERLDPRVKTAASVSVVLAATLSANLWLKVALVVALVVLWQAARLSFRALLFVVESLAFFLLTTMTLRGVIRARDAADAVKFGALHVSPTGVIDGLRMCLQILVVVLALTLLVRTTAPTRLAEGLESMAAPLSRIGLPVHELGTVFMIALRFLPIMVQEFQRMQLAQVARGGSLRRRGPLARARAVVPILIPIVIVTLIRAKELSEAMESRGYQGGAHRTRIRELVFRGSDWWVLAASPLLVALAVGLQTTGIR